MVGGVHVIRFRRKLAGMPVIVMHKDLQVQMQPLQHESHKGCCVTDLLISCNNISVDQWVFECMCM